MAKTYTKEELWKVFDKLPMELKEAVFSQENADHIFSICERHEVSEVSKVAYYVGLVLMGVLLPEEFEDALMHGIGLKKDAAQGVTREINRFVFYPVKPELEQLHEMKVTGVQQKQKPAAPPQEKAPLEPEEISAAESLFSESAAPTQDPVKPRKKSSPKKRATKKSSESDPYRETIE